MSQTISLSAMVVSEWPLLVRDPHDVVGELAANQVAWGGRTLIDGATMADALTGLYDYTGGTSVGVQGDHGMDGSMAAWQHVEGSRCELVFVVEDKVHIAGFLLAVKYMV